MIALDIVTLAVSVPSALTSLAFGLISQAGAQRSGEYANNAAAFAPRDAEQRAAVDVLEIDRGVAIPPGGIAPTIPIPIDRAALNRAARARFRETSPAFARETVRPAQADSLHAPGRTSN